MSALSEQERSDRCIVACLEADAPLTRSFRVQVAARFGELMDAALRPTAPGEVEKLRELSEKATAGRWRVGADLIRIHPDWRDEHGNSAPECFHRNGYAKTIASVGKEDGDWREIRQQVSDAAFIVAAVNYVRTLLAEPATDCPSCGGLNTSCPDGCGRDPKTGELDGSRLAETAEGEGK